MRKSGKHCVKRRNCTFCAISSFVTMFSKSRLLQRRQKASNVSTIHKSVESIVTKGVITHYVLYLLLPQCFSKRTSILLPIGVFKDDCCCKFVLLERVKKDNINSNLKHILSEN